MSEKEFLDLLTEAENAFDAESIAVVREKLFALIGQRPDLKTYLAEAFTLLLQREEAYRIHEDISAALGLEAAQRRERWETLREAGAAQAKEEIVSGRKRLLAWSDRYPNDPDVPILLDLLDSAETVANLIDGVASSRPPRERAAKRAPVAVK